MICIGYDPKKICIKQLLDFFWETYGPITLNRQGADFGTQYHSGILYQSPEQKATVEASTARAQSQFSRPIVTELVLLERFWPSEEYQQD